MTTSRSAKLDEESFFKELKESRGNEEFQIAEIIREWAKEKLPRFSFNKNPTYAVFWPCLDYKSTSYWPIAINTKGQVTISFQYLKDRIPFNDDELRLELLNKFNQIKDINIPPHRLAGRPNFPLNTLKDDESMEIFLDTLEWIVKKIKET